MRRQLRRRIEKHTDEIDRITLNRLKKRLDLEGISYTIDGDKIKSTHTKRVEAIYEIVKLAVYTDLLKVNGNVKLLNNEK